MSKDFNIQEYMTHGVERVVSDAIKATLKNPKESAYMAKFALATKTASRKRAKLEAEGEHIPLLTCLMKTETLVIGLSSVRDSLSTF